MSVMEVPLTRMEVPLSGMEVPLTRRVDLLRIGDKEEKMGRAEIPWRVERQQQLLLLLRISHMQFLTMFSSLNQTW